MEGEKKEAGVLLEYKERREKGESVQLAAIEALTSVIRSSSETTNYGLITELKAASDELLLQKAQPMSLPAVCEFFVQHVTVGLETLVGTELHVCSTLLQLPLC